MQQSNETFDNRARQSSDILQVITTPTAAILIPVVQAVILAFVLSLAVWVLAWKIELPDPSSWAAISFVLMLAFFTYRRLGRWDNMNNAVEYRLQMDLNGDGEIGRPPEVVEVRLVSEDGRHQINANLPTSKEKMGQLARGLAQGRPFSEREWSGKGKLFSQSEFRDVRDEMIRRGLANWNDPEYPQQGIVFTGAGKQAMQTFEIMADRPTLLYRDR